MKRPGPAPTPGWLAGLGGGLVLTEPWPAELQPSPGGLAIRTVVQPGGDILLSVHRELLGHPEQLGRLLERHVARLRRRARGLEAWRHIARCFGLATAGLLGTAALLGLGDALLGRKLLAYALAAAGSGAAAQGARLAARWALRRYLRRLVGSR